MQKRLINAIGLIAVFLAAVGCQTSVIIEKPADGSIQNLPVQVEVKLSGYNFSAQLDGQDITNSFTANGNILTTSLNAQTFPALTPGSNHLLHVYADKQAGPLVLNVDRDDDHAFSITPLPSLSFSSSSLSITLNATQSSTVNIPSNAAAPVNVSLTPSNSTISINSQGAGASTSVTIPQNSSSLQFSVTALGAGSSNITASAVGFQPATIGVVIPTPTFTVSIAPSEREISWGQNTTYTVTVNAENGFTGTVDLSTTQIPSGATHALSPTALNFAAGSPTSLTSTLTITTTQAGTTPGQHNVVVQGTSGNTNLNSNSVDLRIRRTDGAFVLVPTPLRFQNASCPSNTAIRAVTAGSNVRFETPQGNTNNINSIPLYGFSHGCRIGFVIPPNLQSGRYLRTVFYNLGFVRANTGAVNIPDQIENVQFIWQRHLFSPDESLVIIWGDSGNTTSAQRVLLYDLIEDRQIGSSQGFTGSNPAATLNAPNAPSDPNEVVFTYTRPNGNQGTITWDAP